jgi:hypothetical protein
MEAEEERGDRTRTDWPERGGAAGEVAAPEPTQADVLERLMRLRRKVGESVVGLDQLPQSAHG